MPLSSKGLKHKVRETTGSIQRLQASRSIHELTTHNRGTSGIPRGPEGRMPLGWLAIGPSLRRVRVFECRSS
jgi:hypothetical protein